MHNSDNKILYNSTNVATSIKSIAKSKGVPLKVILETCDLGANTFSHMLHGRSIAFDSLAKIADYLDCSVDYLLGRTNQPTINNLNISEPKAQELLSLFEKLSYQDQIEWIGRLKQYIDDSPHNFVPKSNYVSLADYGEIAAEGGSLNRSIKQKKEETTL